MVEDKCPTCPMYGKGYCDCGQSKIESKNRQITLLIILLLIVVILSVKILMNN